METETTIQADPVFHAPAAVGMSEDTSRAIRKRDRRKVKLQEPVKETQSPEPEPEPELETKQLVEAKGDGEHLHTYRISLPHWCKWVDGQKIEHLDVLAVDRDAAIEEFKKLTGIIDTQHKFVVERLEVERLGEE